MLNNEPQCKIEERFRDELDFVQSPIILAGHSHLFSIIGEETSEANFRSHSKFLVAPVDEIKGLSVCYGAWPRTDAYWEELCSFAETSGEFSIGISFRGNDHLARFLIKPTAPIDFFLNELPTLPVNQTFQIVSEALIEAIFNPDYNVFLPILKRLVKTGRRIILIGTPPPKPDDQFLKDVLINEEYFVHVCETLGTTPDSVEFTPLNIRLKLWHLLQLITKRIATEEGGEYLPVPKSALNEDFSLRKEFWANDCTHANIGYGRLVLAEMKKYLNVSMA